MNQACEGASASSAVPVLPATGTDAAARVPVPEVTTSRMNLARSCAWSAGRTGCGGASAGIGLIGDPAALRHGAAIGHRGGHARHLERRSHHLALAVGGLRQRFAQLGGGVGRSGRNAQQVGGIEERLGAHVVGSQLREIGVAGNHDAALHVDRAVRRLVLDVVADGAVRALDDNCPRGHRAGGCSRRFVGQLRILAQRGHGGDHFEGGAGRVEAVARAVEIGVGFGAASAWPGSASGRARPAPTDASGGSGRLTAASRSPVAGSRTTAAPLS